MNRGTKIAIGVILLTGLSVGGYLLYKKYSKEEKAKKQGLSFKRSKVINLVKAK